jgi:hypothetical protein
MRLFDPSPEKPKKTIQVGISHIVALLLGFLTGVGSLLGNPGFLKYLKDNNTTIQDVIKSWVVPLPPVAIETDMGAEEQLQEIEKLLQQRKWQEADIKTSELLHWLTRTSPDKPFSIPTLQKIPCRDLKTIDKLWTHYSTERFGYSIQKSIFEQSGRDISHFNKKVEWIKNNEWKSSHDYDLRAEVGHLPSPVYALPEAVPLLQPTPLKLQRTTPEQAQLHRMSPAERVAIDKRPLAAFIRIPESCKSR